MKVLSKYADWWDKQHQASEQVLGEFVEDHPNWFAVMVATAASTSMQLGAGMVDVLRLGEGVTEGTATGVLKDGIRLLQVAGPAAKLGRVALARFLPDASGGVCAWVAATKALRHTGTRHFASLDDVAKAAGKTVPQLGGVKSIDELVPALTNLGAKVAPLGQASSLQQVSTAAAKGNGVVLFSVSWFMYGKQVAHALYAFKNSAGRVVFADRTGKVVSTLAELEKVGYAGIGTARVFGSMARVENSVMATLTTGLATLALEVNAVIVADGETMMQTVEVRKQAAAGQVAGGTAYTVVSGDSLWALAKRHYGAGHKWPVIYGANRKVIGGNPNLIKIGQKLVIPRLPQVPA